MGEILFKNMKLLDPREGSLRSGCQVLVSGQHDRRGFGRSDRRRRPGSLRLEPAHAHARPDRLSRPCHLGAAQVGDEFIAPCTPHLRHSRDAGQTASDRDARLHDRPGHRRRRFGAQGSGRIGPFRRPAALRLRPGHKPNRRPRRHALADRPLRAVWLFSHDRRYVGRYGGALPMALRRSAAPRATKSVSAPTRSR